MKLSPLAWATERLQNSVRIAGEKSGAEREGWVEDAHYWQMIVLALQSLDHMPGDRPLPPALADPCTCQHHFICGPCGLDLLHAEPFHLSSSVRDPNEKCFTRRDVEALVAISLAAQKMFRERSAAEPETALHAAAVAVAAAVRRTHDHGEWLLPLSKLMEAVDGAVPPPAVVTFSKAEACKCAIKEAQRPPDWATVCNSYKEDATWPKHCAQCEHEEPCHNTLPPGPEWRTMETAPTDGTPIVAWWVKRYDDGTKDKHMQPVVARWREPEGWVWRGSGGHLTGWIAHPSRHFFCAHQSEGMRNGVLACDDCGTAIEDLTPPCCLLRLIDLARPIMDNIAECDPAVREWIKAAAEIPRSENFPTASRPTKGVEHG